MGYPPSLELNLPCNSLHVILTMGWFVLMAKLESQIRQELSRYVNREESLDQFLQWFVPVSIGIDESGDDDAIQLAHRIDGVLAEASSAQWSENDIHEELERPFVSALVAEDVVGDPSPFSTSQSSAMNVCVAA